MELGSITRASEQLLVAQPALGLQIRQLERELDVPLLIRHTRGVSPTAAGRQLYDRALQILDLVQQTQAEVTKAGQNEREPMVLGLTNGITAILGHDVLRDAQTALPSLHLSLVEEMSIVLIDALDRGELDLALAYDVPDRPGFLRVPLIEEEVVFVRSAMEDRETGPIHFESVLDLPLVLAKERDVIRTRLQDIADRLNLTIRIGYEVSSISMLKRLVAEGGVASVMPYASVLDEIERGILHTRRITDPVPTRTLYLVRTVRRGRLQSEGVLFDLLQASLGKFIERMGRLVRPLPAMSRPLSEIVDRLSADRSD